MVSRLNLPFVQHPGPFLRSAAFSPLSADHSVQLQTFIRLSTFEQAHQWIGFAFNCHFNLLSSNNSCIILLKIKISLLQLIQFESYVKVRRAALRRGPIPPEHIGVPLTRSTRLGASTAGAFPNVAHPHKHNKQTGAISPATAFKLPPPPLKLAL